MTDETTVAPAAEPAAAPSAEVEAASPEVVEAPAVDDSQPAVETEEAPKGPLSKREARRGLREKASKLGKKPEPTTEDAEEEPSGKTEGPPVIDKDGRKRDSKTGKFLPNDEGADTQEASPEAEAPQETDQASEPEVSEQKPEPIRIKIDPEHPLSKMNSVTEITAASEEEAAVIRASLNGTHTRRKDVELAQSRASKAEERANKIEQELLRVQSSLTAEQKWMQTPEYRAAVEEYQNIRDAVGEEAASRYWRGIQTDLANLQNAEYGEAVKAAQESRIVEAAQSFANNAWEDAGRLPEQVRRLPHFQKMFTEALQTFDARVQHGHFPDVNTEDQLLPLFQKELMARLTLDPQVAALRNHAIESARRQKAQQDSEATRRAEEQRQKEEEARQSAVEEHKRSVAEKRIGSPPHPLGSIPSSPSDRGVEVGGDSEDLSNVHPSQLKRMMRRGVKEDAARRFNPRR